MQHGRVGEGTAIEISGLTYTYSGSSQPRLTNIDMKIEAGEFVAIFGSTGCGKSTLCRCLNGLIPQFFGGTMEGDVVVCGMNTRTRDLSDFASKVGMVFQNPENQLFVTTVEEEVGLGPMNLGLTTKEIKNRIDEALSLVGMTKHKHSLVDELSAGQKQKIAIAATLATKPEVLILDEPTSQLDPLSAEELLVKLREIKIRTHMTVVLVEHRVERILPCADRVVILRDGRIVVDSDPQDAFNDMSVLTETRIKIPAVVRLTHQLRDFGFEFEHVPLTVEDAALQISRNIKRQGIDG